MQIILLVMKSSIRMINITNSLGPVKLLCHGNFVIYNKGCKNNKIQEKYKFGTSKIILLQ